MASYFRNLFGWGSSRPSRSAGQPTPPSSSKSHSRSQSGSTVPPLTANYIYASSASSHVSAFPPPVPSKVNSYSLPHTHTATPSPLRYPTTDSHSRPHSRDRGRTRPKMGSSASDSKAQAAQIYSRQSHRPKDPHGKSHCRHLYDRRSLSYSSLPSLCPIWLRHSWKFAVKLEHIYLR